MVRSQRAQARKGSQWSHTGIGVGLHMILHSMVPVDPFMATTPLDVLLKHIQSEEGKLITDHTRTFFDHQCPKYPRVFVTVHMGSGKTECLKCHELYYARIKQPLSLQDLCALKVRRTISVRKETAFLDKNHFDQCGLPEVLSNFANKLKYGPTRASRGIQSQLRTDISNIHLVQSDERIRTLKSRTLKWPQIDLADIRGVARAAYYDRNQFLLNLFDAKFLRKMKREGQSYVLEISTGLVPVQEDQTAIQNLHVLLYSMFNYDNISFDLRHSLKQSEVWVFWPSATALTREHRFFKTLVSNYRKVLFKN